MWLTLEEFTNAYKQSKQRGVQGEEVPPETAFVIYDRTRRNPLNCLVLGRHTDENGKTSDKHLEIPASGSYAPGCGINWFGVGSGGLKADPSKPTGVSGASDHVAENFGVTAEGGDKFIGSILAAGAWDYAVNDTWVLAGIHSGMPIYCASALTKDNLISARRNALTITGREVLGLLSFGYKMVSPFPQLGTAFQCEDMRVASQATFKAYDEAGDKYSKGDKALEFFNSCGLNLA